MEYMRTALREFTASSPCTLEYDGRNGSLVVEGGEGDTVRVQIVARIHEERPEDADALFQQAVDGVSQRGSTIQITPPPSPTVSVNGPWFLFNRGIRLDYAVTLPRASECRATSRSGRVEIGRISGPVEVSQRSGATVVRDVEQGVRVATRSGKIDLENVGETSVEAHSGRVSVTDVRGDLVLRARSGAVQVERVAGELTVEVESARADLCDIHGDTRVDGTSGRLTVAEPHRAVRMRSLSGAVILRALVTEPVDIESVSGALHLEIDSRRPFVIDAETISGQLRSDLPPRSGPPPIADAPSVRLRTASGSITLSRYRSPSFDGRSEFDGRSSAPTVD